MPEITDLQVVVIDGVATAVATVTDAETLVGATLSYDWGDFTAASSSTYPDVSESHTYAASGVYPVLVSITDAEGESGHRAAVAVVALPADAMAGLDLSRLLDALASHAKRTGALERVPLHEPKSAVTSGLSAAIWHQAIDPIPARSGLSSTSLRVEFVLRLYDNMLREPADAIDPGMVRVVNKLFNAYNGDFTLGGLVTAVDLLGAYGRPLRSEAGYIPQDGKLMRAVSIYIPVIVDDAYQQSP